MFSIQAARMKRGSHLAAIYESIPDFDRITHRNYYLQIAIVFIHVSLCFFLFHPILLHFAHIKCCDERNQPKLNTAAEDVHSFFLKKMGKMNHFAIVPYLQVLN